MQSFRKTLEMFLIGFVITLVVSFSELCNILFNRNYSCMYLIYIMSLVLGCVATLVLHEKTRIELASTRNCGKSFLQKAINIRVHLIKPFISSVLEKRHL